jgi:hypothetical protein
MIGVSRMVFLVWGSVLAATGEPAPVLVEDPIAA